jgi:trans-aconitate 2-methyltransferase
VKDWDPRQYRQFADERFAPFDDLAAMVRPRPGMVVVDLGCGTGELTQRLSWKLADATIVGIDSSDAMLERAQTRRAQNLRFERGRIEDLTGEFDLIFSNAALQWCAGHRSLLARLFGLLRPDGQLVAQFPARRRPAPYDVIAEIAAEEPARTELGGWTQTWEVLDLEDYAETFFSLGATDIAALERVYPHVLADADAVVEWQLGTVLVPYRERLTSAQFERFVETLRARMRSRWPEHPVFFPFRRTFVAATRPA